MTATITRKPKRKRKIVLWIFGVILAFATGLYFIPNFPFGPYTQYTNMTDAEKSATIPYSRLADSSLELGYTPTFKADAKALKRFPGVRDCLVRSQAKADRPDLRLINWNRIRHEKDAEVCLWWIFLSLETPEKAEQWMQFHKMGLYEPSLRKPYVNHDGKIVSKEKPPGVVELYARTEQWKGDKFRYPNNGKWRPFKYMWTARFYTTVWDANIQLTHVNVDLRTK